MRRPKRRAKFPPLRVRDNQSLEALIREAEKVRRPGESLREAMVRWLDKESPPDPSR